MNIAVIGASAGIGLETVKRALTRGHTVTTFSRSSIEIEKTDSLNVIQGNALDEDDLVDALQDADAAVVALGTGKSMKTTTLFSDFARVLLDIHGQYYLNIPIILVTGFGAGESKNYVSWFVGLFLKYFLKDVYADKTKMEEIVAQSDLKWIIVRPGRLLDKPLTEKYRVENTSYKGINIGAINRADVADFLVKQCENPTKLGQYVGISNK